MIAPRRQQKAYDHRLREFVYQQQSIDFALSRGIPRSTAAGWLKYQQRVISIKAHDVTIEQLEAMVISQAKRIQRLKAIIHFSRSFSNFLAFDSKVADCHRGRTNFVS